MKTKFLMMNKYSVFFLAMLIGGLLISPQLVQAEADTLGYTVSMIEPDTQIDKSQDYFNIITRPGVSQTLKVMVKSLKKDPTKVKIYIEDAMTSEDGQINYTNNKNFLDKSLQVPLSDIVTVNDSEITVSNYEEKIITFTVNPPAESYEGIKLGDIAFQLDDGKKEGKGVSASFAYRIGLLTMEEDMEYKDSQTMKLLKITPKIHRGQKTILLKFQNPEPKILSDFTIDYTVSKDGSKTPMKKQTIKNLNMAPNSSFDLAVDFGVNDVKAGDYILKAVVNNAFGSWNFDKKFTIESSVAKKMNKETAFKLITPSWIKIVSIGLTLLILVTSIFIIIRQKKWNKEIIKRKRKKKKRGRK